MNKHPDDMQAASKPGRARGRIVTELRKTIVGMDESIPRMSIAIFTLGHTLLADDGNLYSPWTDGGLEGMVSGSSHGEQAKTGHAVMIGDDPMNLELRNTSPPKVASALPYQGRYPGGRWCTTGFGTMAPCACRKWN